MPRGVKKGLDSKKFDRCVTKVKRRVAPKMPMPYATPRWARAKNSYFTTITGQVACVTTPEATLPSTSLVSPDLPRVPTTMRLMPFFCA